MNFEPRVLTTAPLTLLVALWSFGANAAVVLTSLDEFKCKESGLTIVNFDSLQTGKYDEQSQTGSGELASTFSTGGLTFKSVTERESIFWSVGTRLSSALPSSPPNLLSSSGIDTLDSISFSRGYTHGLGFFFDQAVGPGDQFWQDNPTSYAVGFLFSVMEINGSTTNYVFSRDDFFEGGKFLGFISDTGISQISVGPDYEGEEAAFGTGLYTQSNFSNWVFDDVAYSRIVSVPEPGTLGMLSAGLLGFGVMRRRRAA